MNEAQDGWGWPLSMASGAALWSAIAMLGERREPWDAASFWSVGYPLSLVLVAAIGALFPQRTWRWAAAVMFAQVPVMVARGADYTLLPLGMIMLAILTLPALLTARAGAWLRRATVS
jgi:hypothetical protein